MEQLPLYQVIININLAPQYGEPMTAPGARVTTIEIPPPPFREAAERAAPAAAGKTPPRGKKGRSA